MFQVRIEHQYASRIYKAESLVDAMELFNLLSKTCNLVQVYGGDLDPICEYNSKWAEEYADEAEEHQHENPLCK
jgi:hypothetical protein